MKRNMNRLIFKQLQIFRTIILSIFNTVNRKMNAFMMDNFSRQKITPYNFFHNKSTSKNIISFCFKRMTKRINENISITLFTFSCFQMRFTQVFSPLFTKWRSFCIFTIRIKTFFTAIFLFVKKNSPSTVLMFCKFLTTIQTYFKHNNLLNKKAVFRSLIEKRLSFLTLLTADYRQRKIASLLANIIIPQFNINTRTIYGT